MLELVSCLGAHARLHYTSNSNDAKLIQKWETPHARLRSQSFFCFRYRIRSQNKLPRGSPYCIGGSGEATRSILALVKVVPYREPGPKADATGRMGPVKWPTAIQRWFTQIKLKCSCHRGRGTQIKTQANLINAPISVPIRPKISWALSATRTPVFWDPSDNTHVRFERDRYGFGVRFGVDFGSGSGGAATARRGYRGRRGKQSKINEAVLTTVTTVQSSEISAPGASFRLSSAPLNLRASATYHSTYRFERYVVGSKYKSKFCVSFWLLSQIFTLCSLTLS